MKKKTKLTLTATAVFVLLTLIACGDGHESAEPVSLTAKGESFTFFDLGRHTKLTKSVRNGLADKLGRDAIQRRNIIDLEVNYDGFLKKHFPPLDKLNRQLNFPPRERVEHNSIKLMYRYARKLNVPFDLVELNFSGYNRKPILFRIQFKEDEANTVEALRQKYGLPQQVGWQRSDGKSLVWEKDGDTLILSYIPNQFSGFDHEIVIYYTANLKLLVETERKEKEARELQREKTGKKAF